MRWGSGALQAASRDAESYPTDGKAGQGGNVLTEISPEAARAGGKIEGGNWANVGRGHPMQRQCGHTTMTEST